MCACARVRVTRAPRLAVLDWCAYNNVGLATGCVYACAHAQSEHAPPHTGGSARGELVTPPPPPRT